MRLRCEPVDGISLEATHVRKESLEHEQQIDLVDLESGYGGRVVLGVEQLT